MPPQYTCFECKRQFPRSSFLVHSCIKNKTSDIVSTVRTESSEAKHFDEGKPDLSMLRFDALEQVSKVFEFGQRKYGRDNYLSGMPWTKLTASTLRHVFKWLGGETVDPESFQNHLAHAVCCLLMLLTYQVQKLGTDDRSPKLDKPQNT